MHNMSFMLTADQICDRTKTVTRRLGWRSLKPGDRIAACKKCMGLKKGEKIERLAVLRVTHVMPILLINTDKFDCAAEGFPEMSPAEFNEMFCRTHKGCSLQTVVTRIEFEYCEPETVR